MKFVVVSLFLLFLTIGCGGENGPMRLAVTPHPSASPTPATTATPTATPTIQPLNYLPVNNILNYETGDANGAFYINQAVSVGTKLADTSCVGSLPGNIGEYYIRYAFPALTAYTTTATFESAHPTSADPIYIISKDAIGNVLIVGYLNLSAVVCTAPYIWIKSQVTAGDTWAYTDINGLTQTATVTAVGQTVTVTVQSGPNGPHNGAQTTFSNVTTVSYGGSYTMFWAPNIGPVYTSNGASWNGLPPNWYIYNYVVSPGSP